MTSMPDEMLQWVVVRDAFHSCDNILVSPAQRSLLHQSRCTCAVVQLAVNQRSDRQSTYKNKKAQLTQRERTTAVHV